MSITETIIIEAIEESIRLMEEMRHTPDTSLRLIAASEASRMTRIVNEMRDTKLTAFQEAQLALKIAADRFVKIDPEMALSYEERYVLGATRGSANIARQRQIFYEERRQKWLSEQTQNNVNG